MKSAHALKSLKVIIFTFLLTATSIFSACTNDNDITNNIGLTYPIVDTYQGLTYNSLTQIAPPAAGEAFYGQDAQYTGNTPSYTDNGKGAITDNVTGLIWTQEVSKFSMSSTEALYYCDTLTTGGYTAGVYQV